MSNKVKDVLLEHGRQVLRSEEFGNAFKQTHHTCTTVADHSLGVAVVAIAISLFLLKLHIKVNLTVIVIASLCHDLGILGRYEKFRNNAECCKGHPIDSVQVYKSVVEDGDERTEDAIRHHMWPLTPIPPRYIEGFILTVADKISALMEVMGVAPMRGLELSPIRFA